MKRSLIVCALIFQLGCEPQPERLLQEPISRGVALKHLNWLVGTWKSVSGNEVSFEYWKKENDTLLSGHNYTLVNNDTTFSERLRIVQRGSDLYYIPSVKDQNDGKPVEFRFMKFNEGEFNFVNPNHDFPQRIIYKNPQPDFLCARIEGTRNGKIQKIDFNFLRVNSTRP